MTDSKWRRLAAVAFLPCLLALLPGLVRADVLADVKAKGELSCGVVNTAKPFGFVDTGTREVVGYDVDVCKAVAKHLGVKVAIHPVASESRIPELMQGRVDLLAAALSWTPERASQIDFSSQYFAARLLVAARNGSGVTNLQSLAAKRISVAKGSTSEIALRNGYPGAQVVSFPDPPTAFLAFQQGKTDAFSISELLMRRFMADTPGAGQTMTVLPDALQTDPWGLGVRKGENGMLRAVDQALQTMEANGEGKAIFDRWFNEQTGFAIARTFRFEPIKPK
jgi:polar amino acid transport system substrate-binding protein